MKSIANINELRALMSSGTEITKCLKRPNDLTARANAITRTLAVQIAYNIASGNKAETIPFLEPMKRLKGREVRSKQLANGSKAALTRPR